jgi:hypothetical protein
MTTNAAVPEPVDPGRAQAYIGFRLDDVNESLGADDRERLNSILQEGYRRAETEGRLEEFPAAVEHLTVELIESIEVDVQPEGILPVSQTMFFIPFWPFTRG